MQSFVQAYQEMPPVTRAYTTACVITTVLVQLEFITPLHLYLNWNLILYEFQWWRLITSFCYFGSVGFTFFFNITFTYRHCQMLEESSFQGKTADFVFMFIFGAVFMILSSCFVRLVFLGHAFTIMLVYVWSRRNPFVNMNFFGLLSFQAPYLPWVLLLFSLLLGNNAIVDIFGIACGHMYFFLADVFPNQPNGFRVLETPAILKWLFDPAPLPHVDIHERPGGYNWGATDDQQPEIEQNSVNGGADAVDRREEDAAIRDNVNHGENEREGQAVDGGAAINDNNGGVREEARDETAEGIVLSDTMTSSASTLSANASGSESLRQRAPILTTTDVLNADHSTSIDSSNLGEGIN